MGDLRSEFIGNYARHPLFQFSAGTLAVTDRAVADFAELYGTASRCGPLPSARWRELTREIDRALGGVFAQLAAGASDDMDALFVVELERECDALLAREMRYYRARNRSPGTRGDLVARRFAQGQLEQGVTSKLTDLAAPQVAGLRAVADSGRSSRADLSRSSGREINSLKRVLSRAFRDIGITSSVGDYVGLDCDVIDIALELSAPRAAWWDDQALGQTRSSATVYAHLDETAGQAKAIVYLSDVGPQNGPTSFFPGVYEDLRLNPLQEIIGRVIANVGSGTGSALREFYGRGELTSMSAASFRAGERADRARRHLMMLPEQLRFNAHFGWDVLPGSDLEASMRRRERPVLGAAGTFVAFDGSHVFHRGGLVDAGYRIALQVVFAEPWSLLHPRHVAPRSSIASIRTSPWRLAPPSDRRGSGRSRRKACLALDRLATVDRENLPGDVPEVPGDR